LFIGKLYRLLKM